MLILRINVLHLNSARFLKCVWPFWDTIQYKIRNVTPIFRYDIPPCACISNKLDVFWTFYLCSIYVLCPRGYLWRCNLNLVQQLGVLDLLVSVVLKLCSFLKFNLLSMITTNSFLDVLLYDTAFNSYRRFFFGCKQKIPFFRICLKVDFQKSIKNFRCFIVYII